MAEEKIRILLVDDDQVDRMAVQRYVRENNLPYELEMAASLKEGQKLLGDSSFDLVLLDYQLGDGTGLEILPMTGDAPVIFVTGSGDEEVAVRAMRMGARDYLIKDPDRNYLKVLSVTIQNVIERKKADEALILFKNLIDNVRDAIFVINLVTGRFIDVNEQTCKSLGYSREELLKLTVLDIETKTPGKGEWNDHVKRLKIAGHFVVQGEHRRKDGATFPVEVSITYISEKNRDYIVAIANDITERVKAEAALIKAKEEAEGANELKDKFVSLVSHDLKAPLATMIGFLNLVRNDEGEPLNEGAKAILDSAIGTGNNMVRLIDDLLSITRIKTGRIKPQYEFIDPQFLAVKAINDFSLLAEQKGVKLEKSVPTKTRIYADPSLIYEVIQNFVGNAVKFCNKGDTVTISVSESNGSVISVSDTGVGIEPDRLEQIFEYGAATSTLGTLGEKGTGFGLPLCRDILESHNGKVRVESTYGEGSAFYAELPVVQPRVLLVEDEFVARESILKMLKCLDIEVGTAKDGKEALAMIEENQPHLIVTDLFMPVMDGFALLERLKGDPELKRIPVIVLTAHGNVENREKAFRLGAQDLVSKPMTEDELIPRIRRYIC